MISYKLEKLGPTCITVPPLKILSRLSNTPINKNVHIQFCA